MRSATRYSQEPPCCSHVPDTLFFIPWLYREGARRGHVGSKLTPWVEWNERQLIGALREGGDLDGLIGVQAGAAIKILPSTIYWNTLRRFKILRREATPGEVVGLPQVTRSVDDATEFLGQSNAVWAPTIPPGAGRVLRP